MWLTTVALAIFAELVEPTGREVCPRGDTASVPSIPKILHFIWWPGSERLPVHLKPNLGAWKSHHSDWELRVWGEAEVTSLIQMEVSWLFQRYKRISTIGKHDLARYAILFHLGGLVVEADTLALRAFDPVLAGRELVLFRAREDMRALGANLSLAMMAAKPQHPLIWRALNASLDDKFDAAGAHRMGIVLHNCSLFAEPAPKAEQSKEGGEARAKEVGAGEAEPRCSSGEGGADVPCAGEAEVAACGCYSILDSAPFLPYHSALSALPHASPQAHMAVLAEFEERLLAHEFPPPDSFSVQYSLLSWVASADSAIAFLLVGVSHALHGNREEAHRLLEPLVWYWWGDRYKYPPPGSGAKPDVRAAKKAYKEALRLAPNMAAAHHELANVHREKGRLLLAVEHYLKARALDPLNYMVANNLAVTLLSLGRYVEAEDLFREALGMQEGGGAPAQSTDPKVGTIQNLAKALDAQGKTEEALPLYRHVARKGTAAQRRSVAPRIVAIEGKAGALPPDVSQEVLERTLYEKRAPVTREEIEEIKAKSAKRFASEVFESGRGKEEL